MGSITPLTGHVFPAPQSHSGCSSAVAPESRSISFCAASDDFFRIIFFPKDKHGPLIYIEHCRHFLESGLTVLIHDGPGPAY